MWYSEYMEKRPLFDEIKSFEEFSKYYWYREELQKICREHGIDAGGMKADLNHNIEEYFKGNIIRAKEGRQSMTRSRSSIKSTVTIHAIRDLAEEETESASKLRESMQSVVEASKSTVMAVQESLEATENMKGTVSQVDISAECNKESVEKIHSHVEQFIV